MIAKATLTNKLSTLAQFEQLIATLDKHTNYSVNEEAFDIYRISSHQSSTKSLAIMALTHGDEEAGLHIICNVLHQIITDKFNVVHQLVLIIANRQAYLDGHRFIDHDLNRLYSTFSPDINNHEKQRVHIIRNTLEQCDALIDIHQTVYPTREPFFIIPANQNILTWANHILPEIPILSHSDNPHMETCRHTKNFNSKLKISG